MPSYNVILMRIRQPSTTIMTSLCSTCTLFLLSLMLLDIYIYILIYFSVYYTICYGGESNRQFINLHFTSRCPIQMNFTTYNMFTEDPMVFQMDSKVLCGTCVTRCSKYMQ